MLLTGEFKGSKSGTFAPEDGGGVEYPYLFAKVDDVHGEGYTKVKPGQDALPAFAEVLKGLKPGDVVNWVVTVDRFGNVRFQHEAA